jgi:hypothetical protein
MTCRPLGHALRQAAHSKRQLKIVLPAYQGLSFVGHAIGATLAPREYDPKIPEVCPKKGPRVDRSQSRGQPAA